MILYPLWLLVHLLRLTTALYGPDLGQQLETKRDLVLSFKYDDSAKAMPAPMETRETCIGMAKPDSDVVLVL